MSQRKIDKEHDEIVRGLRALRNANLFLQDQREISVGLAEKLLKLEGPVCRAVLCFLLRAVKPRSHGPESVVEEARP
jgi:hypothetical protein